MKRFLSIFLLMMGLFVDDFAREQVTNYNSVTYKKISPLTTDGVNGLTAAFSGLCDKYFLVAGGCNYAELSAGDGGHKVYYDRIYVNEYPFDSLQEWKEIGKLPYAKADGASVSVPDGVVMLGGTDGINHYADVELYRYDGELLIQKALPSLPIPLENFGAAYGDGYIYVAGGQSHANGSLNAYRLAYPQGTSWETLPPIPGSARLQPVCVVQNNATAPCFYVMGGFTAAAGKTTGFVYKDGVYFNTHTRSWHKVSPITTGKELKALVGASGFASGCTHIVFVGGVNFHIFEDAINSSANRWRAESRGDRAKMAEIDSMVAKYMHHPCDWYKFNDELLVYHTITDTWSTVGKSELLARAKSAVIPFDHHWLMVGGDIKPGVSSAVATDFSLGSEIRFGGLNWMVLGLYLLLMLALGLYFMKRESNSEDFFKGGGRIPWWAAGISIYATMLSALTFIGYPAKTFATDWTYFPMLITILLVAYPVIYYYLPFYRRLQVVSVYEYLEQRFDVTTRMTAGALFIIFMVMRIALILFLPSLALTAVTGINIYLCILLMGLITIISCTLGGVEAVVWGNVVQCAIIIVGTLFSFIFLVLQTEGGIDGFMHIVMTDNKLRWFEWSLDYRSATFWVILIGGIMNNLITYTSDQTVVQRYMVTKSEKGAKRGILLNGFMSVIFSVIFFAIGTGLYTFFKTHPEELDLTMESADTIYPFFMMSQLPSGVAGILIAAIFAASMSTVSSSLNSVSTVFTVDFYGRMSLDTAERKLVRVARLATLFFGLVGVGFALLMATWDVFSMLDLFQEMLGLLISGLGGLFFMGIFMPRIGEKSALLGFCLGVAVVFIVRFTTDVSFLLYGAIGFVSSVLIGYSASFLFRNKRNVLGLTWWTQRNADE